MKMFADELLRAALEASPKDIVSQNKKMQQMAQMIVKHPVQNERLKTIVSFTCEKLKKMGYIYEVDKIYEKVKEEGEHI